MTIFEKLNEARLRFQNAGIQKSGKNAYAGYTYYELSDILPAVNKLANELKFCCVVNFENEIARLDFCDLEKDEKITFTSPMSTASLKGCHEVQNLGAVETYIKRYLYQNCFEIVESDVLDETMNPAEKTGGNSEVDNLIAQVKERMNTFNDAQLDYANKAIKQRNVKMLNDCLKSK
ncbi:MAG: ERF family protein [Methanobrevibacter sp.]|nr:ERF family protein [Methanobrevibacter sp.]MBO7733775.1 ERF family protein [Methanobrevibacter sp.]